MIDIPTPAAAASPFAALSFIAAPALLTNASCVLLLGTINRYGRALDRARSLARLISEGNREPWIIDQIHGAERRVLMIAHALAAFYTAIGAFALGTLASVIGAAVLTRQSETLLTVVEVTALAAGVVGVSSLIYGAATLATEALSSLRLLRAEADHALSTVRAATERVPRRSRRQPPAPPPDPLP